MKWILGIIGLLAANAIAMAILAVTAANGHSQVIPAYYERAVHYDDALDQAAANRALGWRITAELVGGTVIVDVRDRSDHPITGARVHVIGYQRAHAADAIDVSLAPDRERYRAPLATRPGWHDLTITVERDGAKLVADLAVVAE